MAAILLLTACSSDEPNSSSTPTVKQPVASEQQPAATPADPGRAPTFSDAANLRYTGMDQPVVLVDGRWEGEPFMPGGASRPAAGLVPEMFLQADLDHDGAAEGVVWLWTSAGGSGVFMHMAVIGHDADGAIINLATAPVGDRVQLRTVSANANRIILETVEAGPEDPMCCGAQKLRRTFTFLGGRLEEQLAEDQGRLGLADLDGGWTLVSLDGGRSRLAPEPAVTMNAEAGAVTGSNGCNNYRGRFVAGELAGDIRADGPFINTRMACPDEVAELEQAVMSAMQSVTSMQYLNGRLGLRYDGGLLLWERQTP